eukprot:c20741_g1_i9.p1 GENE.c20741_g1_i9~~c20741_g1_i9.p1  ORF type:complete len:120 (+),score=20.59 c20741_g1_i9:181-540(+)
MFNVQRAHSMLTEWSLHGQVDAVYESKVSREVRTILSVGCVCTPVKPKLDMRFLTLQDLAFATTTQLPYLETGPAENRHVVCIIDKDAKNAWLWCVNPFVLAIQILKKPLLNALGRPSP